MLEAWGQDLSALARQEASATVGRLDELREVMSALLSAQVRLAVVSGESGVGKTHLLHALASNLRERRPELRLIALNLGELMAGTMFPADRENLLARLLKEARASDTIVALEHLELALWDLSCGAALLEEALQGGTRLVGTVLPSFVARLSLPSLARRLHLVELAEPAPDETEAVLIAQLDRLSAHHKVRIDRSRLRIALECARPLAGFFPAKAITLLDQAAARGDPPGGHRTRPVPSSPRRELEPGSRAAVARAKGPGSTGSLAALQVQPLARQVQLAVMRFGPNERGGALANPSGCGSRRGRR